jgi:tetratricopeptide (TPR) repeat protein
MMLQRNLASARMNLGEVLVQAGDLREGQAQLNQAAATDEFLSTKDPANGRLVEDLSYIYIYLGDSEVKKGLRDPALRYYAEALKKAEQQAKRDPLNEVPQFLLAKCYQKFGAGYETEALQSHLPEGRESACRNAKLWFSKSAASPAQAE